MPVFADSVSTCRDALVALLTDLTGLDDPADLGAALLELDALRGELATVRDDAEQRLVAAMGDLPELTVPGATLMVRRSDSRKAWAHKDLAADLAERLVQSSIDFETGERLKTTEELITEVLDYAGVSYWKVTALNKMGMTADEYCEVTEGPLKIRIQRTSA